MDIEKDNKLEKERAIKKMLTVWLEKKKEIEKRSDKNFKRIEK